MARRFLTFASDWEGSELDITGIPYERRQLAFQVAVETRRFEIERFWQRSLFFWGFLAVSFVGYANLDKPGDWRGRVLLGCFGVIASLAWTLQNRGAKYWQEAWEQKVVALERDVLGVRLFRNTEQVEIAGWFGASRYSVSRLAIILSDFTVLIWLALLLRLVRWWPDICDGDWVVAGFLLSTICFAGMMVVLGRSEAGNKQRA